MNERKSVQVNGRSLTVYEVDASPADAFNHENGSSIEEVGVWGVLRMVCKNFYCWLQAIKTKMKEFTIAGKFFNLKIFKHKRNVIFE